MVSLAEILSVPVRGPRFTNVYRLARSLRPLPILDLGVGDGQAADSLLMACPTSRYVGLMNCTDLAMERELREKHAEAWIELHDRELDSSRVQRHFGPAFDLVHVATDVEGECLADLRLAKSVLRTGGHFLVDGFGDSHAVREAVAHFLHEAGRGYQTLNLPWHGGDLLLCKPRIA